MSPTPDQEDFEQFLVTKPLPSVKDIITNIAAHLVCPSRISRIIQNGLEVFACNLNDQDSHFINEIVQNFDDNSYGDDEVPKMTLRLHGDELFMSCNEVGMSPMDVFGICSVGDSTKKFKKYEDGCTGEKGIGFKTIFRVSSSVDVFSVDPQSKQIWSFNLTETPREGISYIVPQWLDKVHPQANTVFNESKELRGTCLVLHLKQQKMNLVREQIKKLQLDTLLFLRRLVEIDLFAEDFCNKISKCIDPVSLPSERSASSAFTCTLTSSSHNDVEAYLVIRDIFPMAPCKERGDARETLHSIAIPLDSSNFESRGKLFAYIPMKVATGLPFHVNADFVLSASRESYQREHSWNIQLEHNFVDHIRYSACALAQVPAASMLVDPLQLVPLSSAVWLHQRILGVLRQAAIVPVWGRTERAMAPECCIVPAELLALNEGRHPPHTDPHIVDLGCTISLHQQRAILEVQAASKATLVTIVNIMLEGRSADPEWYCKLYTCMATVFRDWTPSNTPTIPNFILREDEQQVALAENSSMHIWPRGNQGGVVSLLRYCSKRLLVAHSALPCGNDLFREVCAWFSRWNIREVSGQTAAQLATQFIREECQQPSEVIEATMTLLACPQILPHIRQRSLPLVCRDGTIKQPPFHLPIVKDSELLSLFDESRDCGHLLLMSPEYNRDSSSHHERERAINNIFMINPPPLPDIFSWMSPPLIGYTEQRAVLFFSLLAVTPTVPYPSRIRQFLSSQPCIPTTMGMRVASEAYFPIEGGPWTPHHHRLPFVTLSLYGNPEVMRVLQNRTQVRTVVREAPPAAVGYELTLCTAITNQQTITQKVMEITALVTYRFDRVQLRRKLEELLLLV